MKIERNISLTELQNRLSYLSLSDISKFGNNLEKYQNGFKYELRKYNFNNIPSNVIFDAEELNDMSQCFGEVSRITIIDWKDLKNQIIIDSNMVAIRTRRYYGNVIVMNNNLLSRFKSNMAVMQSLVYREVGIVLIDTIPDDVLYVGYLGNDTPYSSIVVIEDAGSFKFYCNKQVVGQIWCGIKIKD